MSLIGIHHVAIICSDYERSKQFYLSLPGAELLEETLRVERQSYKLDIRIGDSQLELFSFPQPPQRPSRPEACGLRHLAFRVTNLERMVSELATLGIETEPVRLDQLTGKRFTFFKDPDDLPLEIYEL
ncbi:MAG: VOC family protein [Cyanobacteria bacterium P01_E01_bin.34]